MKPKAAANQLTTFWRTLNAGGQALPVDAAKVAEALRITIIEEEMDPGFVAALLIGAGGRAIVLNKQLRHPGRRNFSIAHELGHNSCHADRKELRCTWEDLTNYDQHSQNIEREANEFAATLLMPADDVRDQIQGKPITLETADTLRERYNTSMTAMAIRMVHITDQAASLVFVKNGVIDRSAWNQKMKWPARRGGPVDADLGMSPTKVDPELWLAPKYGAFEGNLYASTLATTYDNTTIALLWAR